MTPGTSSSSPEWSRLRWLVIIGTLAAVQSGLLIGFVRWPSLSPAPTAARAGISLSLTLPGSSSDGTDPFTTDPRQFAVPDPSGFSGSAHRALPSPDYRVMEWKGESRWLGIRQPGARFGTGPASPSLPAAIPPPPTLGGPVDPSTTPLLLRKENVIQVRGALAGRSYESSSRLAPTAGGDVLAPTVIEIQVDPAGDVLRARLVSSCGSREVDLEGIQWARHLQFQPVGPESTPARSSPSSWMTGELVIYWHVEPPLR